ncbi:fluoride efflux transporter CrcB [Olsenella sp. HMSC062G07]|uniref:fluoride efflux transporter CrcB n=1 Tax=Olsenella sp. HMSC062G07 TaxID=1739330 RepID=UPI001FEF95B8|nr:fluoride efflux transporter CrcB [Olsenella sp. HMSC062G07]
MMYETVVQALAVGFGGFVGSVGRWGIGAALEDLAPGLPAGTLAANALAGLIIGVVTGMDFASPLDARLRLLLATGLCGGLSTFSTFSAETLALAGAGNLRAAAANVIVNVASCLLAVAAGLALGRVFAAG